MIRAILAVLLALFAVACSEGTKSYENGAPPAVLVNIESRGWEMSDYDNEAPTCSTALNNTTPIYQWVTYDMVFEVEGESPDTVPASLGVAPNGTVTFRSVLYRHAVPLERSNPVWPEYTCHLENITTREAPELQ